MEDSVRSKSHPVVYQMSRISFIIYKPVRTVGVYLPCPTFCRTELSQTIEHRVGQKSLFRLFLSSRPFNADIHSTYKAPNSDSLSHLVTSLQAYSKSNLLPYISLCSKLTLQTAFIPLRLGVPAPRCTSSSNMACLFQKLIPFLPSHLLCLLIINLPVFQVQLFSFPSPTSPVGFQALLILLASAFIVFIFSALGVIAISLPFRWPSKWPIGSL